MLKTAQKLWHMERLGNPFKENMSTFAQSNFLILPKGAHARIYFPTTKLHSWILSLHGGPESYEDQEIRYGGLYIELLKFGIGVAVLNYRGSKKENKILGRKNQTWGRWESSIYEDYQELQLYLPRSFKKNPVYFLGSSFGGALALLLAKQFPNQGLILFSPLLDLKTQIRRGKNEYGSWFQERFSAQDISNISCASLIREPQQPVFFAYGTKDEVLGTTMFNNFSKILCKNSFKSKNILLPQNCRHYPSSYSEYILRYCAAFNFVTSTQRNL